MIGSSRESRVHLLDDLPAQDRVGVHHRPLFLGQAILLEEDRVRDADLADVVKQPAPLEGLEVRLAQPHHPPDVARDRLDPLRVQGGVRIPLVHRRGERGDGLGEHLAHLGVVLVREARHVEREREQQAGPRGDDVDLRHEPPNGRKAQDAGRSATRLSCDHAHRALASSQRHHDGGETGVHGEVDRSADERGDQRERECPLISEVPWESEGPHCQAGSRRRDHDPRVVRESAVPGHSSADLSDLSGCRAARPTLRQLVRRASWLP